MIGDPARQLAPHARWVWALEQLLLWGVITIGALVAVGQLDLPGALRVLPLAGLLVGVTAVPALRWRRWRWDVSPEAVELRRGVLTVTQTLVPMHRVQHVDTTRDIVEQGLGLATVVIHTAAGSHKIPLLRTADAEELRDRIARLAGTDER